MSSLAFHLAALALITAAASPAPPPAQVRRPILITVDDLPLAAGRLHTDPGERERITRRLLDALRKHHIQAVAVATGKNHPAKADLALLGLWLDAGHELGNHSFAHLDYSETDPDTYIADVEKERAFLHSFLEARGRRLRFFRFPFLNEGDTKAKLDAMRGYLERSGQTNLPVTIDNQDWSFEEAWVRARRAGDREALRLLGEDYQAAMRLTSATSRGEAKSSSAGRRRRSCCSTPSRSARRSGTRSSRGWNPRAIASPQPRRSWAIRPTPRPLNTWEVTASACGTASAWTGAAAKSPRE